MTDDKVTADDLRILMACLEQRVALRAGRTVEFDVPDQPGLIADGVAPAAARRLLSSPWLGEMVSDVRETPEFCADDDSDETVLSYARDTVIEYLRKRFPVDPD